MDSYEEILSSMKNKYRELTSTEVPELSDIDIRMKVLAGEIYNNEVNLEFIKRQVFPSTATGEYLNRHAYDRGVVRKPAVKAKGEVRFLMSDYAQQAVTVPAGTVVSTSGENPVRFKTDGEAVIPVGDYFVTVNCTAQMGGISGNVGAGTIDTLITNVVGIDSVTNLWAFTGGNDIESDESLRQRVLDTYKSVSNGTNKSYYKKLALSVEGVYSVNVVPAGRGAGTVDIYIASQNSRASNDLINSVQNLVDSQREINVDALVSTASVDLFTCGIYVTLKDGYDLADVRANIRNSVSEYISTLDVGESVREYPLSSAILKAEGVYDFEFNNLFPSSLHADEDTLIVLDDIIVSESGE
ncbi:MAG: baseplate J/gp47 family protein [Ruminococcus sp.]|nr:baseplate J/gp47 family protein [Ruminococcus sp.]